MSLRSPHLNSTPTPQHLGRHPTPIFLAALPHQFQGGRKHHHHPLTMGLGTGDLTGLSLNFPQLLNRELLLPGLLAQIQRLSEQRSARNSSYQLVAGDCVPGPVHS